MGHSDHGALEGDGAVDPVQDRGKGEVDDEKAAHQDRDQLEGLAGWVIAPEMTMKKSEKSTTMPSVVALISQTSD